MTVRENLQMGAELDNGQHFAQGHRTRVPLFPVLARRSINAAARFRAASSRCWPSPAP
jgi:ABC-type branched-subunit amino acid transport system ATPase component